MLRMKIIISTYSSPKNHSVPVYAHNALFLGKIQAPFLTQFQLYFYHGFSKNIFIYSLAIIYTMYIHIHSKYIHLYTLYLHIYILYILILYIQWSYPFPIPLGTSPTTNPSPTFISFLFHSL